MTPLTSASPVGSSIGLHAIFVCRRTATIQGDQPHALVAIRDQARKGVVTRRPLKSRVCRTSVESISVLTRLRSLLSTMNRSATHKPVG